MSTSEQCSVASCIISYVVLQHIEASVVCDDGELKDKKRCIIQN